MMTRDRLFLLFSYFSPSNINSHRGPYIVRYAKGYVVIRMDADLRFRRRHSVHYNDENNKRILYITIKTFREIVTISKFDFGWNETLYYLPDLQLHPH